MRIIFVPPTPDHHPSPQLNFSLLSLTIIKGSHVWLPSQIVSRLFRRVGLLRCTSAERIFLMREVFEASLWNWVFLTNSISLSLLKGDFVGGFVPSNLTGMAFFALS
jgi:hypothetical protein